MTSGTLPLTPSLGEARRLPAVYRLIPEKVKSLEDLNLPQVLADPSVNPWLVRLAVLRETGEIVGLVNFHAPPDSDGMVEIGYRVIPAFRRRGYATRSPGCRRSCGTGRSLPA